VVILYLRSFYLVTSGWIAGTQCLTRPADTSSHPLWQSQFSNSIPLYLNLCTVCISLPPRHPSSNCVMYSTVHHPEIQISVA